MNRKILSLGALVALAFFCGAFPMLAEEGAAATAVQAAPFAPPPAWQQVPVEPGGPVIPGEPIDPEGPVIILDNVWCCKPDGNCAKIKVSKCNRLGGVQHPTEAACTNDPNC